MAQDLGVGVIDVATLRVESPEKIANWLRKTTEVVPAEQVCVATDCAIASMRRVVAKKKLQALVAGTEIVRMELAGRR